MSETGSTHAILSIRRNLELPGATVAIDCRPGTVTVLNDENGGSIQKYCRALSSGVKEERFSVELGGKEYRPGDHIRVGFDSELPESVSITEFLQSKGFGAEEIENIINTYDLRSVHYLHCAQLPETAKRQVQLLIALHSTSPVLLLNDPFLPFNGRWREAFAALLLEHVERTKSICVITNLSFAPKCWLEKASIVTVDVGALAERTLKRTQELILKQEAEKEKAGKSSRAGGGDLNSELAAQADRELDELTGLPRIAWYAFRETRDFIFDPLARISRMFRSFGGAAAVAGFAFLVLVMGVVMFPYLSKQRAIISELAAKFDVSWSDIKTELQKPDPNVSDTDSSGNKTNDEETAYLSPVKLAHVEEQTANIDSQQNVEIVAEPKVLLPELELLRPTTDSTQSSLDEIVGWLNTCEWCTPDSVEAWPPLASLADSASEFDYRLDPEGGNKPLDVWMTLISE